MRGSLLVQVGVQAVGDRIVAEAFQASPGRPWGLRVRESDRASCRALVLPSPHLAGTGCGILLAMYPPALGFPAVAMPRSRIDLACAARSAAS